MLTRRDLIAALGVLMMPAAVRADQKKPQKPRENELKTVTLIIDGMT